MDPRETDQTPAPRRFELRRAAGRYAVVRLAPSPESARTVAALLAAKTSPAGPPLFAAIRTEEELTLVADESTLALLPPAESHAAESGFAAISVVGPLDFSLVGVLAELTGVLARAGVSVFVLSTFSTDWILVREDRLETALAALESAGHAIGPSTTA